MSHSRHKNGPEGKFKKRSLAELCNTNKIPVVNCVSVLKYMGGQIVKASSLALTVSFTSPYAGASPATMALCAFEVRRVIAASEYRAFLCRSPFGSCWEIRPQ